MGSCRLFLLLSTCYLRVTSYFLDALLQEMRALHIDDLKRLMGTLPDGQLSVLLLTRVKTSFNAG